MLPEELYKVRQLLGTAYDDGRYEEAAELFDQITTSESFVEFLTLPAYEQID
jgi:malate synthase